MFTLFLLVALLVTLAVVFVAECGTGTDKVDEWKPAPIAPTFVTRDYSF